MSKPSIYIRSIKVDNLRTFGEEVSLNFQKEDGTLPQWTLILGDNGIGKSTLLQCVVWMKPNTQDASGSGIKIKKDDIEPIINNEENEILERLVKKGIDTKIQHTHIEGTFIAECKIGSKKIGKGKTCDCTMDIWLDSSRKLYDVTHTFDTNSQRIFLYNEIPIFCYSASRVLGKSNIYDPNLDDTVTSFLNDSTILYDAEEILHTVNYAAYGAIGEAKRKYKNYLDKIKLLLASTLPDFKNKTDLVISTPKLMGSQMTPGQILVNTKHGESIPFSDFSLGYKTVISWLVDLSWRMFNKFPDSEDPLSEPAIVIIDELDLHLHPIWQRLIINELSNYFKNVQFIATAHSPLMVQAAQSQNYAIVKYTERGAIVVNEPEGIDGWRVDQILTSEFFGLTTSRTPDYERDFLRRKKLMSQGKLTKKEKKELEILEEKLANTPTGDSPEEINNRKIISELAQKIIDDQTIIEA